MASKPIVVAAALMLGLAALFVIQAPRGWPTGRPVSVTSAPPKEAAMSQPRVLVLMNQEASPGDAAALENRYRVTGRLPPRILVLDPGDRPLDELAREPGVAGVFESDVPADLLQSLRPEEQLFVNAWAQQQSGAKKVRPGEGLSWDAPGFQAPDRPPRKRP